MIFIFFKNIFCERLSQLRKQKNLTLEQFGTHFNVTKQTTSRWEKGDRLPPIDVITEIADFFNVSLDYLVGRSNFSDIVMKDEEGNIVTVNSDNPEINK